MTDPMKSTDDRKEQRIPKPVLPLSIGDSPGNDAGAPQTRSDTMNMMSSTAYAPLGEISSTASIERAIAWSKAKQTFLDAKDRYDALPHPRGDDNPEMLLMNDAEDELIALPAPDAVALGEKLRLPYFEGCVPDYPRWESILADVVRILPPKADILKPDDQPWQALLETYQARLRDERAFYAANIAPFVDHLGVGPERSAAIDAIQKEIWAEDERLSELRCAAEDPLMDCSSPDASAFAFKFLVAYGDGRDANGWNDMLEAEARRLALPADLAPAPAEAEPSRPRSIEQQITYLDRVAQDAFDDYGLAWVSCVWEIGGSVMAGFDADATDYITLGARCDGQEQETSAYLDALRQHQLGIDGARGQIFTFIRKYHGHLFVDERPEAAAETTIAIRAFLTAGFRLFLDTKGRVQTGGSMPKAWWHGDRDRQIEIANAGRAFDQLRRRWNADRHISRAIRMLGALHDGSGCVVLEREER